MKKLSLTIFLAFLMPCTAIAQTGGHRESCEVCGMYIDVFHDTSCELALKDGETLKTCGVACMLRIVNDRGGPDAFKSITVHDWEGKETVPAKDATYVIGSRVVPDMIPNVIAFAGRETAESFQAKEGGEILDFNQALLSISPMGLTMPTRIKPAALPPRGAFGAGLGYMYMVMDEVKLGSNSEDPDDFIKRPGQKMGPKKMTSSGEMIMFNYGLLENLAVGLNASYLEKKMEMYKMGGKVTDTTRNSGFGDIGLNLRYNLWKNPYYSKFFSLLAETTIPTGDFDEDFITMPGLQLGTGAFTFTGGLLFSHREGNFWFHYLTSYTTKFENSDEYKFGDRIFAGAAAHYTPNYDLLLGLEADASYTEKDEYRGEKIGNTGGYRSNITAVADYKFLTVLGGSFSLRLTGGIPVYEDLNHYYDGMMEKAKLGGGWFVNAQLNFRRRFPVY
jgi:nitrous oxide reductase accessory protein NosL